MPDNRRPSRIIMEANEQRRLDELRKRAATRPLRHLTDGELDAITKLGGKLGLGLFAEGIAEPLIDLHDLATREFADRDHLEHVWQVGERAEYTDESLQGVITDAFFEGGLQFVLLQTERGIFRVGADHLIPADDEA